MSVYIYVLFMKYKLVSLATGPFYLEKRNKQKRLVKFFFNFPVKLLKLYLDLY